MNFSKATDFQYVYGDLSSIIIDNDIMPVRPEATKNHLRGMDIAFGLEAVEERAVAINLDNEPVTYYFENSISKNNLNSIVNKLSAINDYTSSTGKLFGYGAAPRNLIWNRKPFQDKNINAVIDGAQQYYNITSIIPCENLYEGELESFDTNDALQQDKIENIYQLIDKSSYIINIPTTLSFDIAKKYELVYSAGTVNDYLLQTLQSATEKDFSDPYTGGYNKLYYVKPLRSAPSTIVVGACQYTGGLTIGLDANDINKSPYQKFSLDAFEPITVSLICNGEITINTRGTGNYFFRNVDFNYNEEANTITISNTEITRVINSIKPYIPTAYMYNYDSTWYNYVLNMYAVYVGLKLKDRTMWTNN